MPQRTTRAAKLQRPELRFYVTGSNDEDSLMIRPDIAGCRVEVQIPVQALPWRDIRVIEKHGGRRAGYGCCDHSPDPLALADVATLASDSRVLFV